MVVFIVFVIDRIFVYLDSCFVDICVRWVLFYLKFDVKVFVLFVRILLFVLVLFVFFILYI